MEAIDAENKHFFTLRWEIENAALLDSKRSQIEATTSPFRIRVLQGKKFVMEVFAMQGMGKQDYFCLFLYLKDVSFGFPIDIEWSFLSSEGKTLSSSREMKHYPRNYDLMNMSGTPTLKDVFGTRRADFLHHNTLSVRLRIFKSHGDFENDEFIACKTRLETKKFSIPWNIPGFSCLELNQEKTFPVVLNTEKGSDGFQVIFSLQGLSLADSNLVCQICSPEIPEGWKVILTVSVLDINNKVAKSFGGKVITGEKPNKTEFTPFLRRKDLLGEKQAILKNDVLTLLWEITILTFTSVFRNNSFNPSNLQELDFPTFFDASSQTSEETDGHTAISLQESDFRGLLAKTSLSFSDSSSQTSEQIDDPPVITSQGIESLLALSINLYTLHRHSIFTDFEIQGRDNSVHVHKNILCARSEMLRDFLTNDTKESTYLVRHGDIKTLNRALKFMYSGFFMKCLDWNEALDLYCIAHKFQVQSLKDECFHIFRTHITSKNVCELFLLSHKNRDKDLETLVNDLLLSHFDETIRSPDWAKLMESDTEIASLTMHRIFLRTLR